MMIKLDSTCQVLLEQGSVYEKKKTVFAGIVKIANHLSLPET